MPVRSGLHAGEIEVRGQDIAGVGVHIAARVMAEAAPAEVMVSRTVRDLVVGSEFRFVDRGLHRLKGVDGEWQLFALAGS
jgi:class 3 adenylate cyclase